MGAKVIGLVLLGACAGLVWAAPGGKASSHGESAGRALYLTKCAKCHKLYEPGNYSDGAWRGWLTKMGKKSKLSAEQQKLLSSYFDEQPRSRTAPERKR